MCPTLFFGEKAENGKTPCGVPGCTLRRVLEYLPQSTLAHPARRGGKKRTGTTASAECRKRKNHEQHHRNTRQERFPGAPGAASGQRGKTHFLRKGLGRDRKKTYLCRRIGFAAQVFARGLKGNRVQIPDSPAAVMLRELLKNHRHHWPFLRNGREGFKKGASQKTCHSSKDCSYSWD